jgi:hypothetical protein
MLERKDSPSWPNFFWVRHFIHTVAPLFALCGYSLANQSVWGGVVCNAELYGQGDIALVV